MSAFDNLDWFMLLVILIIAIVACVEYLLKKKQLAKGTFIWMLVVTMFFVFSLFFR